MSVCVSVYACECVQTSRQLSIGRQEKTEKIWNSHARTHADMHTHTSHQIAYRDGDDGDDDDFTLLSETE